MQGMRYWPVSGLTNVIVTYTNLSQEILQQIFGLPMPPEVGSLKLLHPACLALYYSSYKDEPFRPCSYECMHVCLSIYISELRFPSNTLHAVLVTKLL